MGEQDFDLIVANISGSSLSSSGIPFPWGGTYASPITAPNGPQGQLVNFLVPRSQFFNSVLGQAILNNSPLPTKSNSPAASANDQISGLTLAQLACYWQNLAVAQSGTTFPDGTTSNGPTLCSGVSSSGSFKPGNGISPGTTFSATVHADTSCSSSPINCQWGGVPSQPNLENGLAAPALQAVITLNLTSDSNLTYLLAALLDNNTTASNGELGVNGYFEDVTNELPSLGLNTVVTGALANEVLSSGGFFGYPTSFAQPPPPPPPPQPTCSGFGCLWNTVSGAFVALGETIAAGIVGIAGAVWSGIQAATTFFEEVGQGLVQLAETAKDAAVSALEKVASAVEAALQALINYILNEVAQLMHTIIKVITSAIGAYLGGIASSLSQLFQDLTASSPDTTTILVDSSSLLLSLFGIQSFVNSLSNVMSTVMSVVNPILNIISLNRLLSIISNALGAATGFNPLADIQSALNQVASGLFSAVADALTVPFSLLGIADDQVTVPSSQSEPFPSNAQAINSVNALVSSSGNPGLSGDFRSSTNPDPSTPELIDIAHIGVIVAIILLLSISGAFGTVENALQFFVNAFGGGFGTQPTSSVCTPCVVLPEAFGLVWSLVGLLLPYFLSGVIWPYELTLGIIGMGWTWFFLGRAAVRGDLAKVPPPVAILMGANAVLSATAPVVIGLSAT